MEICRTSIQKFNRARSQFLFYKNLTGLRAHPRFCLAGLLTIRLFFRLIPSKLFPYLIGSLLYWKKFGPSFSEPPLRVVPLIFYNPYLVSPSGLSASKNGVSVKRIEATQKYTYKNKRHIFSYSHKIYLQK